MLKILVYTWLMLLVAGSILIWWEMRSAPLCDEDGRPPQADDEKPEPEALDRVLWDDPVVLADGDEKEPRTGLP